MIRKLLKKFAIHISNLLIRKYNTRIIIVYGWDWSEGLRESLYNLVSKKAKVRRNPEWIDWDMGLPLFVMGFPHSVKISRLKIFYYLVSSLAHIYYPSGFKRNYLVVSLHARSLDTVQYWAKLKGIEKVIVLPLNEKLTQVTLKDLEENFGNEKVIDLASVKPYLNKEKTKKQNLPWQFNFIQQNILGYLHELNKVYFKKKAWQFSDEELGDAVSKIDWERYFLERVEHNLFKETHA